VVHGTIHRTAARATRIRGPGLRRSREEEQDMKDAIVANPRTVAASAPAAQWPQQQRDGVWLTDEHGRRSIALHCAGGVFNLGFGHHALAREVADIVLEHDMGLWHTPSQRRLEGERGFAQLLPAPLRHAFFTTGGSEAFEVACKLVKRATGRRQLVSVTGGYYGALGFSMAMEDPVYGAAGFAPLAGGTRRAVFGDIDSLAALVDDDTAAVCIESIQVPAGVRIAPAGYFASVRRLCDARGALLVVDEVQGGLMRTGSMWAIDHEGVTPDVLTCGKGLSGGYYPVAALAFGDALHACTQTMPMLHRASFSGSEIGARVAARVAQRYLDPALGEHVRAMAARLERRLAALRAAHPGVLADGPRGRGLVQAVDAVDAATGARLLRECAHAGLYIKGTGISPRTVLFMPPLIIGAGELDEALARFETALLRAA